MRINRTNVVSTINLAEGGVVPTQVQVLRVGKFKHPRYGEFEITSQTLSEMKSNFDKKVRGIDTAFDYFHDSDKEASAWVNDLILKENGTELWADVKWTPKAEQKLAERELRYFSPDFAFKWEDPESGQTHKNVLFGGGLTNRPFVKEMMAIVADELNIGVNDMTELEKAQAKIKELETANVKLSEDKAAVEKKMADMPQPDKVAQLEQQIAALQAELQKAKGEVEVEMAEKKKAQDEMAKSQAAAQLAEKEKQFNILLSEGKAVAAQKEAFMGNKMDEFIKLAQPVNLKANGSSSSGDPTADADAQAVIKLAEEKQKANPKMPRHEALSIAKKELKK